jgi:hypothetical protein
MWGLDLGPIIQAILFAIFAGLTAIVSAVIGPIYDNLLVPELAPGALYPSLVAQQYSPWNYLSTATQFSTYLLTNIVDPAIALVAIGVAALYLFRTLGERWARELDALLPRLVIAVVASNFTVPIASAIISLGASIYPTFSGWDGGAWQQWQNLAGVGQISYSWDNGALAFVMSIVEFFLVFGLVLAVGVRDALLAVLIVVLPIFTLLWPLRPLSTLARRAWLLFAELVFLPCILVIPLELAVGSPSPVLLVAYLGCAISSPFLLSMAGTHVAAFGFPSTPSTVNAGAQRGLSAAPAASGSYASGLSAGTQRAGPVSDAIAGTVRVAGSASAPAAAPLVAAQLVGRGATHLVRHLRSGGGPAPSRRDWPPVRSGGPG